MTHAGDDGIFRRRIWIEGPYGLFMVSPERALLVAFSKWAFEEAGHWHRARPCLPLNPDFSLQFCRPQVQQSGFASACDQLAYGALRM